MKKVFLDSVRNLAKAVLFVLSVGVVASCGEDSGLGASVDTEAPKVEITYPPTSSVIRENFILAGTCSDDMGVSSVVVSVKKAGESDVLEQKAAVIKNNSWSIELNEKKSSENNEWDLPVYAYKDGKYEIEVVAYDGAGHSSGKNSRTVEIDNTPPVFFITSPQIDDTAETEITNYGTRLKIVGTIADEHKVQSMSVVVYDEEGNIVANSETDPITVNDVPTVGGTSETIARFLETSSSDDSLCENYISIYFAGDEDESRTGDRKFSCKILLTDESKVYRDPPLGDEISRSTVEVISAPSGNSSSKLYAYYNIRNTVGADVFDANTMMKIINGTYTGDDAETLKNALMAANNSQDTAKFTLNPKANPTYSVIGLSISANETNEGKAWSESTRNASTTVVAQQGLNQTSIEKNSVRTYLLGPIDDTYTYTKADGTTASRQVLVDFVANEKHKLTSLYGKFEELSDKFYANYDSTTKTIAKEDELFEEFKAENAELVKSLTGLESDDSNFYFKKIDLTGTATGSGESYTYPYTIPEELPQAGKCYLLFSTGWDKDGLSFTNGSNYFGFKFSVSSNAPTFNGVNFLVTGTTDTVVASDYTNKGALTIQGSAKSDSNSISKVDYAFNISDESASGDDTSVTGFTYLTDPDYGTYVSKGQVEFEGTNATESFSFDLLEKLTDAQKELLKSSGHRYLYSVQLQAYDTMNKTFTTQYVVHIDTKKPEISFTNAKVVYTDSSNKNWINGSGLTQLRGSIDEENPRNVSYVIKKNGLNQGDAVDLGAKYSFDLGTSVFSGITLNQGDKVQVVVTALDKAGNSSEMASDEYIVDATVPVMVESDDESVKSLRINNKKYVAGEKNWLNDTALTFEGYYTETDSGVNAVYYVINPETVPTTGEEIKALGKGAIGANSAGKFSSVISGFNGSGESTIYIAAEDNVGNMSSVKNYQVYIDQKGPSFTEVQEDNRNLPANGTSDINFEITVVDQEGASGLTKSDSTKLENLLVIAIENGNSYKLSEVGESAFTQTYNTESGVLSCTIKKEYISATSHESADANGNALNRKFDGNVTLQITVSDNAGNSSTNQQFILQVDSSAPKLKVTAPSAVSESETNYKNISWITGKTTIQGTISDVGVSGVDSTNFKYLVPTRAQQTALSSATDATSRVSALADAQWLSTFTENDGVTWSLDYQSSFLEAASRNDKNSFVYYAACGGESPTYATIFDATLDDGTVTKRYRTVPVYFLVTDKAGNKDVITSNKFYVDIEGGKPKISISYPKDKTDSSGNLTSWAKLSEEVALQGTAQDNEAVTKVELKELWYATADAGTVFAGPTGDYWTRVNSSDATLITVADLSHTKSADGNLTIGQTVAGTSVVEAFDIECNLTPLAESLSTQNKKITAVKAVVAVEDENGYGYEATRYAFIDTETPSLYDEKIVKLATPLADGVNKVTSISNGTLVAGGRDYTVLAERKYEADMWLSGADSANWYYIATVKDDSTLESVNLSAQSDIDFSKNISIATSDLDDAGSGYVSYTFAIPIPTGTDGNLYSKLTRNDGAHKDVNSYISLNIDNTAPQMRTVKYDSTREDFKATIEDGKLKLVADGDLGEKYVIENSNGSFSMGDQVQEKGSGLAFIGFWFERNSKSKVYNPVVKASGDNQYKAGVTEKITADYGTSKTSGSLYLNDDKFPALYVSASNLTFSTETIENSKFTAITYTGLGSNAFINRSYGMVKINGGYYKVQKVDGDKIILNSDLGLKANVDVEFIYANFVDHIGTETYSMSLDGSTYEVSNDDDSDNSNGDGIAESLKVKSGVYTWTAEFDSNNMDDGPVRINVVTMDNAGNMNYAFVDTSIQNNRPRIAKVFLATDLDGSGTFDFYSESNGFGTKINPGDAKYDPKNPNKYDLDSLSVENGTELGEFMFFSTLDEDGNSTALANVKDKGVNSNFIVMDKLLILPEIVGGNTNNGTNPLKYTYDVVDSADSVLVKKSTTELGTFVSGDGRKLSTVSGSAYDSSVLPANGILFDSNDETSGLGKYESWTEVGGVETKSSKFFGITIWDATGIDDSAITQGENTLWALLSVPVVVNVKDDIAPKPTITPFYWNSKDDSSTVYDEENQPLGHIDYLNNQNEVMAKPGVAGEIYLEGVAKDDSRVDAIYITDPSGTETLAAKRDGGWKVTASDLSTTWPNNWKAFEILSEEKPTQKGNAVYWRLTIDTSKYGVASDQVFTVSASDKSNNKSTPGSVQTKNPEQTGVSTDVDTDYYEMDFVPYIKSIALADGSVLRSRLGRYSVRAGESIIIEGMNFGTSGSATVHFYKSENGAQGAEVEAEKAQNVDISDNKIVIDAPAYSRFVAVTVGEQTTQNNTNSNLRGYNIEEGYVVPKASVRVTSQDDIGRKKASQNGTNFWNDDRYLSVWNVETTFDGSINPHSGVIKKVTSENSDGGKLYSKETGSAGVDPVSDLNDTYFGAISSDDLRVYTYDLGSQSGKSIEKRYIFGQNNTDIFRVPADALDCVILNGMPYYVVQDNWVGNVDANCWGPGLYMARAGWQWNKTDLNSDGNPANQGNYHVIIEKQGDSGTARGRSSTAGYDYVLQQFKNPRIAGWHKDVAELTYDANRSAYAPSTDYIYISYYDSYARCLKYAAYRAGHRVNANGKFDYVGGMWGSDTGRSGGAGGDLSKEMRMADDMTGGKAVVAGFDTLNNNPSNFVEEAGEWSDIFVDPSSKMPVIIYYNKTKKSLEVAVGKQAFPVTGNVVAAGAGYASGTDNSESSTGWTKTKDIRPNSKIDFGSYVSAAIDGAGNLHVAAQDATNAKLYYLYLKKSGDTYSIENSALVDSSNGAGRWTDIELTNPTGSTLAEIKPVISYINTSFLGTTQGVKVAYLESVAGTGSTATLNFEAMTDPAKWQAGDQRTSVLPDVKETKSASNKAIVGVGFNSDMLALDFLRGE